MFSFENSIVGPNVSIGSNSSLKNVQIANSVVWNDERINDSVIDGKIVASCTD